MKPVERPKIKLACMSLMWGYDLTNEAMADWLNDSKAAGYDGVATFDRNLLRFVREADFKNRLAGKGLSLASVDWRVSRDLDGLKALCEVMASMGCRHLVALMGESKRPADVQQVADLLNQAGRIALDHGIQACYHNHTNSVGETLQQTEDLLARTDPQVFFGFVDTGHATKDFVEYPAAERAAVFLERNWDRLRFLEFKDWSPETDLNTEVGAGRCDYAAVFRILKDKGYSGWITVEQNGPMGSRTRLESATASREFIRKGLGV